MAQKICILLITGIRDLYSIIDINRNSISFLQKQKLASYIDVCIAINAYYVPI